MCTCANATTKKFCLRAQICFIKTLAQQAYILIGNEGHRAAASGRVGRSVFASYRRYFRYNKSRRCIDNLKMSSERECKRPPRLHIHSPGGHRGSVAAQGPNCSCGEHVPTKRCLRLRRPCTAHLHLCRVCNTGHLQVPSKHSHLEERSRLL